MKLLQKQGPLGDGLGLNAPVKPTAVSPNADAQNKIYRAYGVGKMEYTLKGIKVAQNLSEETYAFTATLYQDKKAIADVKNNGRGGSCVVHAKVDCRVQVSEFENWCDAQPSSDEFPMNSDSWLTDRVADDIEIKTWQRQCKKSTLIRLKDHTLVKGDYSIYKNTQYSAEFAKKIRERFGDELVEIINERFIKE